MHKILFRIRNKIKSIFSPNRCRTQQKKRFEVKTYFQKLSCRNQSCQNRKFLCFCRVLIFCAQNSTWKVFKIYSHFASLLSLLRTTELRQEKRCYVIFITKIRRFKTKDSNKLKFAEFELSEGSSFSTCSNHPDPLCYFSLCPLVGYTGFICVLYST